MGKKYIYRRRRAIVADVELPFYRKLDSIVGASFVVLPQAHLSTVLEHRILGQDWEQSFVHLDTKRIDFVICRRRDLHPVVAVELEDHSTLRTKSRLYNKELERVLAIAGVPLVRFHDLRTSKEDIAKLIVAAIRA